MEKKKLESKMKLFGDTGSTLAAYIGIARTTFSAKINETHGAEFTQSEIAKIKQRYGLTAEEIDSIFFTSKVSSKDTIHVGNLLSDENKHTETVCVESA